MSLEIMHFTMSDYDDVVLLWKQCEGIGLSSADSCEKIDVYLERNPGMSFVAREKGILAGAVLCGHDGRRGYIHHLAVHPEFRKKGIGRKLADKCFSALESHGIEKCHIFVFMNNENGIGFWNRAGWLLRADVGIMSRDIKPSSMSGCLEVYR